MHEPPVGESGPLALEALALRYAAGDLSLANANAFEARLAGDQEARDALAEAVRLSAAALGQSSPSPDQSFRNLIRERLRPLSRWTPNWLSRRAYRGHPLAWGGLGASVAALAAIIGVSLADRQPAASSPGVELVNTQPTTDSLHGGMNDSIEHLNATHSQETSTGEHARAVVLASNPAVTECHDEPTLKEAEIWAELSTPNHVEKAHDEDIRMRQRLRGLHPGHPDRTGLAIESHGP